LYDNGFSLSRFDLLYRDALLYGSMDVMNDSLWGSINIAGADLGTLPLIAYLPDSIEGLLDVNIDVNGYLNAPRIRLQSSLRKAQVLGVNAERTRTRMEYADKRLLIRNFTVDFEAQRSLQISGSIPLDINFARMNPVKLLQQDSINADINVKNARFSKLVPLLAPDLDVSGTANFQAAVDGTMQDPRVNGELRILAPRIDRIPADTLFSKIRYRNARLYFNDVRLIANNGSYRGNAHLYTDLSITPKGPRFSADSSVYAYIQGRDDELLYLTPFLENIENLNGDFFTELEIRGSLRNSMKNGLIRVRNGRLILDMLANEIENLEGELRMKDNIADVDLRGKLPSLSYTLAGVLGLNNPAALNTHNFRVGGKMDMKQLIRPKFDVRITGNQVSVVTLDENYNLTTEEVDITVQGRDTLQVAGDVTIREGLIELGFTRPVAGIESPADRKIYTEYALNANVDKIYLRNQFIDATLAGEMMLLKYASDEKVRIGGQLDVSQGFFNYWASVFELDEGSIVFDQFQGNHELNFTAFKPISRGNRIIASITGPLNNPEIDFIDEDNLMSKAEIVRELTIGQIENTFSKGGNTAQRTTTALLALAERPLEQQAQKLGVMSGLDRIDIKGGEATYIDSTTAVIVGGRIGRNFYLTYEGSRSEPMNIEIEYRINNRLSIVGTADDESVSGAFRLRLQY
ncbi:MAG: translocation/assembly module TamB domain-containing protein, partial [Candidatus Marinimicrobia bacterium]|nr:translocation/assembly module TamB domain-containing protein [Candidatus Neomarinimicrobiota bacterium]